MFLEKSIFSLLEVKLYPPSTPINHLHHPTTLRISHKCHKCHNLIIHNHLGLLTSAIRKSPSPAHLQRDVFDLHRKHASGDLDHRTVREVEELGEELLDISGMVR